VHAELAADDEAGIGFPYDLQRRPLTRVLAHAVADRRSAAAESQKSPAAGDQLAIAGCSSDLLRRDVAFLNRAEQAESDQAIARRMG
jgi:hypothetical protein